MENGPLTSKTYQPGKTNNFCILNGNQLCRNFLSATHLTNANSSSKLNCLLLNVKTSMDGKENGKRVTWISFSKTKKTQIKICEGKRSAK